jgi:hypothetical protein
MPRITGDFAIPALDKAAKTLHERCTQILKDGTKEWVEEVKSIVPNWSGMSRASLQPIADKVGVPLFPLGPQGPDIPDRVAQGRAMGEAEMKTGPIEYTFTWRSTVFHFVYNEGNNANNVGFRLRNPGPYESQRRASKAFFDTVIPQLRTLGRDISIKTIRRIKV